MTSESIKLTYLSCKAIKRNAKGLRNDGNDGMIMHESERKILAVWLGFG